MNLDQSGFDFIKSQEGFRSKPYLDQAGIWTIGFGHTEGVDSYSQSIDESEGEHLLWNDIELVEKCLLENMKTDMTQNEYNAVCSFIFNIGEPRFLKSTLFRKLNLGDKIGASKEFLRWDFYTEKKTGLKLVSQDLSERRKKEQAIFLTDINLKRSQTD